MRSLTSAVCLVLSLITAVVGDDPALNDATLHDVAFVDRNRGWAVGDHGVIWATSDGGQSWSKQTTNLKWGLRTVHFLNENTGWVAGGHGIPYSVGSSGMVLGTRSGGEVWEVIAWQQFPRIQSIKFDGLKSGWATSSTSAIFPTGLFRTESMGTRWRPASGPPSQGWSGLHLLDATNAVVSGSDGAIGVVRDQRFRVLPGRGFTGRIIHAVAGDGKRLWAVGDGGLVLASNDRGTSWRALNLGDFGDRVNWHSAFCRGDSVWIVGRPGSLVLHSPDAGNSWQAFRTGQSLPLNSVCFVDADHGWAVGAMGTIIATNDGGRSWALQRSGGRRAAVLAVNAAASETPLLAHGQLADRGYLTVDLAMTLPKSSGRIEAVERHRDGVVFAGGSSAELDWRFQSDALAMSIPEVLSRWDRVSEQKATDELEARIVAAIRIWRPDVVIGPSPDPRRGNPTSALIAQWLERAFQSAADPGKFPDQLAKLALQPWQAKRLFLETEASDGSALEVSGEQISSWSGKLLSEQGQVAQSFLLDHYREQKQIRYYRLAKSLGALPETLRFMMDGISLEPGGEARRELNPAVQITAAHKKAQQANRTVQALIQRAAYDTTLSNQIHSQLDQWLVDLGPYQSGHLLMKLARKQFREGNWVEARELLEKLRADYPSHLVSAEALRWLIQFYASSELRARDEVGGFVSHSVSVAKPKAAGSFKPQENPLEPARQPKDPVAMSVGDMGSRMPWVRGAVDLGKQLAQLSPLSWSDPRVQFPIAASHRLLGNTKDADRFFTMFAAGKRKTPWHLAAQSERWLRERRGLPPKPLILSQLTARKPYLDGRFDELPWTKVRPQKLKPLNETDAPEWATELRIAHDHEFLYLAIDCRTPNGQQLRAFRPRSRDMDVTQQDRVHLYLDLDRDYSTYYHFAVDGRGATFEDCWGDASWNPDWFVHSENDPAGYRLEIAIRRRSLHRRSTAGELVWAFNAVRVVPGERVFSWSQPAGVDPHPEGLGLLMLSNGSFRAPAPVAN